MSAGPDRLLEVTRDHLSELRAAAAAAYPKEFCALLIGNERAASAGGNVARVAELTRIVAAANLDPVPERGFELDPVVLVRELRALREAERKGQGYGERLLGHAHSHPDSPAAPSARDLAQVNESGQIWLIVPVPGGRSGSPRAFEAILDDSGQPMFRPVGLLCEGREISESGGGTGDQETP
jgi:proteasome lid subunit RPN8/RPN11